MRHSAFTLCILLLFSCFFTEISVFAQVFAPVPTSASTQNPFMDAAAVWNFQDLNDSNDADGRNSRLEKIGDVELNVSLSEAGKEASRRRGGDGKIARFSGKGFLSAGQGADGEVRISGQELTFCLRVRFGEIPGSFPIFSKHGGHENMEYNLFAYEDYIGVEIGTTGNKIQRNDEKNAPISGKAYFSEMRSPETAAHSWHDVICRVKEAKMELFVDGRCVDEDFVLGELKQNDVPLLFGAQDCGEGPAGGFVGDIDTAAIWNRALSDAEIMFLSGGAENVDARERTDRGNGENLQYWCPPNAYGVGDCFPFTHDGVFHFAYLLDKKHHASKNGWGAQWVQATSTDLVHWKHQPFLVEITSQNEGSICTGSVFFHKGVFYAIYTNRSLDEGGKLNYAVSSDGIHFEKAEEPVVRLPEDTVHLYATTSYRGRGCWAHLTTKDMKNFELRDPLYFRSQGEPECPDWFQWGNYYYLIAGVDDGIYRISENLEGPWRYAPGNARLGQGMIRVPKTAPWKDGRRIIVGFTSQRGYGGDAVFHELIQFKDGSLGEKFVPEMIPASGEAVVSEKNLQFREKTWENLPNNYRLRAKITLNPKNVNELLDFSFTLGEQTQIRLVPAENLVIVGNVRLENVDFSEGSVTIDAILIRDILDVCVQNCRAATISLPKTDAARTLTVTDDSELLLHSVPLERERKLPQAELPVKTGYTLELLDVAPLAPFTE